MLFIDLKDLKIVKDFHYETIAREINFDIDGPLMAQSDSVVELFSDAIKPCGISVLYDITIAADETSVATDEEVESFISVANFMIGIFFANMIKEDGRKREHRFDVPEKLQVVKVNRSTLKKAVNQQTINDVFNLQIHYKDLTYILCDEKEAKEEPIDA